jgi:hypothetical protein
VNQGCCVLYTCPNFPQDAEIRPINHNQTFKKRQITCVCSKFNVVRQAAIFELDPCIYYYTDISYISDIYWFTINVSVP